MINSSELTIVLAFITLVLYGHLHGCTNESKLPDRSNICSMMERLGYRLVKKEFLKHLSGPSPFQDILTDGDKTYFYDGGKVVGESTLVRDVHSALDSKDWFQDVSDVERESYWVVIVAALRHLKLIIEVGAMSDKDVKTITPFLRQYSKNSNELVRNTSLELLKQIDIRRSK